MNDLYALYSLDIGEYSPNIIMVGSLEQCINIYDNVHLNEKVICPYSLGQTVCNLFGYKWFDSTNKIIYTRNRYFWEVSGDTEALNNIIKNINDINFWAKIDKKEREPQRFNNDYLVVGGIFYSSKETADLIRNYEGINYVNKYDEKIE